MLPRDTLNNMPLSSIPEFYRDNACDSITAKPFDSKQESSKTTSDTTNYSNANVKNIINQSSLLFSNWNFPPSRVK